MGTGDTPGARPVGQRLGPNDSGRGRGCVLPGAELAALCPRPEASPTQSLAGRYSHCHLPPQPKCTSPPLPGTYNYTLTSHHPQQRGPGMNRWCDGPVCDPSLPTNPPHLSMGRRGHTLLSQVSLSRGGFWGLESMLPSFLGHGEHEETVSPALFQQTLKVPNDKRERRVTLRGFI